MINYLFLLTKVLSSQFKISVQDQRWDPCGYQPGQTQLSLDGSPRLLIVNLNNIFHWLHVLHVLYTMITYFLVFDGDQFCGGVVIDNRYRSKIKVINRSNIQSQRWFTASLILSISYLKKSLRVRKAGASSLVVWVVGVSGMVGPGYSQGIMS